MHFFLQFFSCLVSKPRVNNSWDCIHGFFFPALSKIFSRKIFSPIFSGNCQQQWQEGLKILDSTKYQSCTQTNFHILPNHIVQSRTLLGGTVLSCQVSRIIHENNIGGRHYNCSLFAIYSAVVTSPPIL